MCVSHKVICIFYHLRCGTSDLFSSETLTSCKLANIKHVITEQQAACQLPGKKTSTRPPADLQQRLLTPWQFCSSAQKNSNIFYILSSNLKKKIPLLRIFWQSDAFHKQQKYPSVYWPHLLFSTLLERHVLQHHVLEPFLVAASSWSDLELQTPACWLSL